MTREPFADLKIPLDYGIHEGSRVRLFSADSQLHGRTGTVRRIISSGQMWVQLDRWPKGRERHFIDGRRNHEIVYPDEVRKHDRRR